MNAEALIAFYRAKNYRLAENPGEINICYIEGANEDGAPRENTPNQYNDRRIVFLFENGVPVIVHNALATSEPGRYYTEHPLNPKGAARIALGQHLAAWRVGTHKAGTPTAHEALVQCAAVQFHRDGNKDFSRAGDPVFSGLIGLDQHAARSRSVDDIGKWSAACLVEWDWDSHLNKFMRIVKNDPRYKKLPTFAFDTAVIESAALQPYFAAPAAQIT